MDGRWDATTREDLGAWVKSFQGPVRTLLSRCSGCCFYLERAARRDVDEWLGSRERQPTLHRLAVVGPSGRGTSFCSPGFSVWVGASSVPYGLCSTSWLPTVGPQTAALPQWEGIGSADPHPGPQTCGPGICTSPGDQVTAERRRALGRRQPLPSRSQETPKQARKDGLCGQDLGSGWDVGEDP